MEKTIKKILTDNISNSEVLVDGADAKYTVKIVSDIFLDKSRVLHNYRNSNRHS